MTWRDTILLGIIRGFQPLALRVLYTLIALALYRYIWRL
jgi:hypothetical protein